MSRVGGEDELFSLKGSNVITLFFFWTIQQGFQPRTIFDFFRLSRLREGEMLTFTFLLWLLGIGIGIEEFPEFSDALCVGGIVLGMGVGNFIIMMCHSSFFLSTTFYCVEPLVEIFISQRHFLGSEKNILVCLVTSP